MFDFDLTPLLVDGLRTRGLPYAVAKFSFLFPVFTYNEDLCVNFRGVLLVCGRIICVGPRRPADPTLWETFRYDSICTS